MQINALTAALAGKLERSRSLELRAKAKTEAAPAAANLPLATAGGNSGVRILYAD